MFLTVGGSRAVELKLANALASDRAELLRELDVSNEIAVLDTSWIDRAIFVLNRPFVTALLLLIGLVALYFEFSMPGIGLGGVVSLLCFSIFFWSHFLGGTAGWLEVVLFLLGITLLLMEIFVIPGFGIAGISGIGLIVVSLTMALQDYGVPSDADQWRRTIRGSLLILGTFLGVMSLVFGLIRYARVFPALKGITLEPPVPEDIVLEETLFADQSTGISGHVIVPEIGARGVTESVLRPAGKARFGEQIYDVISEGDFVEPHTDVIIVKKQAQVITVRKLIN
jgi:membrane-bound serine protease (ClpP class)